MKQSINEQIVSFVNNTKYEDLPDSLISLVKEALIDYVGVTIAGCNQNSVNATLDYARYSSSKQEATIFGRDEKSSVEFASMVNATASHVLDFDDVSWATIGHPTVVVAPVCFSMAEKYEGSGKDIILAYALAVEVMHKLADITMPYVSQNGWHTTPTYGVFGSVVAGAVLKKSSSQELLNALGVAASKASGVRSNFGTDTKSYHAGMACYNGLESLYLAQFKLRSSPTALEDVDGFIQTFANEVPTSLDLKLGVDWDLEKRGLVFKQYPCCSGSHPAADLTKELVQANSFELDDIQSIKVGCSLLAPKELKCDFPKTALEAKFSMRYAVASMIIYKRLTLDEFTNEKVLNPTVQELMDKIEVQIDEEFEKLGFIGTSPARITIYLNDGRIIEDKNMLAKGNPEKRLSSLEIEEKFLQCTKNINRPKHLYTLLQNLENVDFAKTLTTLC